MFIRQLEYLVTLAREQHFAKAAEACHVSQPALSSAIRGLEKELGVMIVERGRRYIGLTSEGERVLAWAQQTLASLSHMREDASTAKSTMTGTLRIGAIPTTMTVAAFLTGPCFAAYPNIRYTLSSLTADAIVHQLDHFELDLGLTYLDDKVIEGFEKLPLFDERYVLLADRNAAHGPLTWEQAARLPLCLLTGKMRNRQVIDAAFRRVGVQPTVILETDSLFSLYAHVSEAGLFSIVPHSLLNFFDLNNRVQARAIVPQLTRAIGLIARNQPALAPITGAVWEIARALRLQERFDVVLV
ncbi:MAG TPA: LysR family transcriptional regulator [Steroidobacteraceae bacterium]|nr:LysR family transcriptional regulator [Steroidobacteraceae bacterium]